MQLGLLCRSVELYPFARVPSVDKAETEGYSVLWHQIKENSPAATGLGKERDPQSGHKFSINPRMCRTIVAGRSWAAYGRNMRKAFSTGLEEMGNHPVFTKDLVWGLRGHHLPLGLSFLL